MNNLTSLAMDNKAAEIALRRSKIDILVKKIEANGGLKVLMKIDAKTLKGMSKEFKIIHGAIEASDIVKILDKKVTTNTKTMRKLNIYLSVVLNNLMVNQLNLKEDGTPHQALIVGLYSALKQIEKMVDKNQISPVIYRDFVYVASEIGLRLYSIVVSDMFKEDEDE